MNPSRMRSTRAKVVSGALCLACTPGLASAQAWLPGKGELSWSLDQTAVLNKKHYFANGAEIDVGHTDTHATSIGVIYGISDRFTVKAELPYISTRYRGAGGGGHDTEIDNGNWHSTVTDLHLSLHYQATDGAIAFAPYLGAVIPTHSYVVQGHAAPGRGVEEIWVGFYAGASLNDWIPRTYVQARYNYAFVDTVFNVTHDRSNVDLELGYFLNRDWSVRALASWQDTHGGIDIPVPVSSPIFPFHDVLASASYLNLGAGVSWSFGERWSAYAIYVEANNGRNAHKVDHRLSVGISYGIDGD